MHPVLLRIGPLTIGAYSALLALGFLAGTLLALRRAKPRGIRPEVILDVGLISLVTALVGARALHLATQSGQVSGWRDALSPSGAGLSMYGGVLAAIGASWLYTRWRRVPFLLLADACAPSIALGHGLTRIGCFLNGCCYGRPTPGPFGVRFPPGSHAAAAFGDVPLHPTQLYTAVLAFAMLLALLAFDRKPRGVGQPFGLFLALEGIGRFGMELVRAHEPGLYALRGLTVHQLIALGLLASGLVLLARRSTPEGGSLSPAATG
jgi:phosphatidylglycerol:prolipoprotein diacylglycerol transferase